MAKRQRESVNAEGERVQGLEDQHATLCDVCGLERPPSETRTCWCGAQVCDDCTITHGTECRRE